VNDTGNSNLPEPKIDQEKLEEYRSIYEELLGFVPPRIQARTDLLGRLDPEFLSLQEEIRKKGMYPDVFDVKTVQLMLFGMLLLSLRDAARIHGIAARRAGATWEEMQAVVNLAYLYGGLSAANIGAQFLQQIAEMETEQRAGATGDQA
jgi:alkylhydroperoxidase/carboxymuconolactone decarboxylase family protein YurZ